ncbi:MAG: acetylxylan esterase [Muribaculaceae bacterium]
MKRALFSAITFACIIFAMAQPSQRLVSVTVTPSGAISKAHINSVPDAYYFDLGKTVKFNVEVKSSGIPLDDVKASYTICYDKMQPHASGEVALKNGCATVKGGTMNTPGFLRCSAQVVIDGEKYSGSCAVAFAPEKIKPAVTMPADFEQWWNGELQSLEKIEPKASLKRLDERCTEKVDVYQVKIASLKPIYGILAVPKAPGKYPAVMRVPGAGIHRIGGYLDPAENGFITLDLGIHSLPFDADAEVYTALSEGALFDYTSIGIASRESYYYRKVYLGCVSAAKYLTSLPQYDGKNLFVVGGSQGGALSIVTAALFPKVTAIMSFFPALCDQQAYLDGRAGGWPHYFLFHRNDASVKQAVETIQYYDVVNFARILTVPVFMSFGYNDLTCAPTSTYACWNSIAAEQKSLLIVPETGHWRYSYQWKTGWDWMMQFRK